MPSHDPVRRARARLAGLHRFTPDPTTVEVAREALVAAHVERAITTALTSSPPLRRDDRLRLASMLLDGVR